MELQEIIKKININKSKSKLGELTVKNIPYIVRMGQLKGTYKND